MKSLLSQLTLLEKFVALLIAFNFVLYCHHPYANTKDVTLKVLRSANSLRNGEYNMVSIYDDLYDNKLRTAEFEACDKYFRLTYPKGMDAKLVAGLIFQTITHVCGYEPTTQVK